METFSALLAIYAGNSPVPRSFSRLPKLQKVSTTIQSPICIRVKLVLIKVNPLPLHEKYAYVTSNPNLNWKQYHPFSMAFSHSYWNLCVQNQIYEIEISAIRRIFERFWQSNKLSSVNTKYNMLICFFFFFLLFNIKFILEEEAWWISFIITFTKSNWPHSLWQETGSPRRLASLFTRISHRPWAIGNGVMTPALNRTQWE